MNAPLRAPRALVCISDTTIREALVTQLRTVPALMLDVAEDSTAVLALFTERVEYWPDLVVLAATIGPMSIAEMVTHLRRTGLHNTPIVVLGQRKGRREQAAKAAGATRILDPALSAEVVTYLHPHAAQTPQSPPGSGYDVHSIEWNDLHLDYHPSNPGRSAPEPMPAKPHPGPVILVVAQDRSQRMALARLCETAGAQVSKAATDQDAGQICRAGAIDLAVVAGSEDLASVTRAIGESQARPIPIYLVIPTDDAAQRVRAQTAGITQVLNAAEAPKAIRALVKTAQQPPRDNHLPTLIATPPALGATDQPHATQTPRRQIDLEDALSLNKNFRDGVIRQIDLRVTTVEKLHDELRRSHRSTIEQYLAQMLPAMSQNFCEDVMRKQRRLGYAIWGLLGLWLVTLVIVGWGLTAWPT